MSKKRIVVTGMSINTPIGDTLEGFLENLLAGKSAITRWKSLETDRIYAKVGGDLGEYDVHAKIQTYKGRIPDEMFDRLVTIAKKSPFCIAITLQTAVEAFLDAGFTEQIEDGNNIACRSVGLICVEGGY